MNRSFKFVLSAALFLCGCSFIPNKVDATVIATQENCKYHAWMNYTVEQEGSNISVKFGDVTPLYLEARKSEKTKGAIYQDDKITTFITKILGYYHANIAIVDNIKYEYDAASETLTVTGYEGSRYGTAYNFVVNGVAYFDMDEACRMEMDFQARKKRQAASTNPQTDRQFKNAYYEARMENLDEHTRQVMEGVKVPPIKKVVFLGNVQKIGEDFGRIINEGATFDRVYGIESVDMSGSDVKLVCNRAFRDCRDNDGYPAMKEIKYPAAKQPKIGMDCFGQSGGSYRSDNFIPVYGEGSLPVDSCCIIS